MSHVITVSFRPVTQADPMVLPVARTSAGLGRVRTIDLRTRSVIPSSRGPGPDIADFLRGW